MPHNFGAPWLAASLALAIHVADEASHDFLATYNPNALRIRRALGGFRFPPTFTFWPWLLGLAAVVLLLLSLTPAAFHGARWLRPWAFVLAIEHCLNGLLHLGASAVKRRAMPGVLSAPLLVGTGVWLLVAASGAARPVSPTPLLVFNAAALGPPFHMLGDSLRRAPHPLELLQESAPSLDVIRKVTEMERVPDVLATADIALFDALIVPRYSTWYVVFGSNALVLAYGPRSEGSAELTRDNWWEVLLRPGVRIGRSDPGVDPSGYRTLMALQLAELHYGRAGLAKRLLAAMPERYVRRAEADLSALLQAGELDYIWTYRNLARAHRLEYLELPAEVNLADPSKAAWYAQATATLPGRTSGDSMVVRGAPILFAMTVPKAAQHPDAAEVFLRLLVSPAGADILRRTGFEPLDPLRVVGQPPARWAAMLPH